MNKAQGRRHETALRRFREAVCFACALALWLLAWRLEQTGFGGERGHAVLLGLGAVEAIALALLFWAEQASDEEDGQIPWITLAWASLPAWAALDLVVGSFLGG